MGRKSEFGRLFELPEKGPAPVRVRPPTDRIWTRNKALLIERYLYYFVKVTAHGTYIDGFAAPHDLDHPESWSARRVIEGQPLEADKKRLRHFHLFERDRRRHEHLTRLRDEFPRHDIRVYLGDFNDRVDEILVPETVSLKEAAFALLDQYAFDCQWETLEKLARYQAGDRAYKIELFYFLQSWLFNRTKGRIGPEKARLWWGRDDWEDFFACRKPWDRAVWFCRRMEEDLGYDHVKAWPIFTSEAGNSIAYFMIHATDHPRAPALMDAAYNDAQIAPLADDQLAMELGVERAELAD